MKKGIVADTNKNQAVLLTDGGGFITVTNRGYQVGQTVFYTVSNYHKRVSLMVACFVLVMMLGCGGVGAYYTPVGFVNVDTDSSMRLEINMFDKVIKAVPLNEQAKNVLANSGKLSHDLEECIKQIADSCDEQSVNNGKTQEIYICATTKSGKVAKTLNDFATKNKNTHIEYEGKNEPQKAKKHKTTVTKSKDAENPIEEHADTTKSNAPNKAQTNVDEKTNSTKTNGNEESKGNTKEKEKQQNNPSQNKETENSPQGNQNSAKENNGNKKYNDSEFSDNKNSNNAGGVANKNSNNVDNKPSPQGKNIKNKEKSENNKKVYLH